MSDSDSDLVSVKVMKSTALVTQSMTLRKAAMAIRLLTFLKEKESLAKLNSIVEKARKSVGNESSTLPLVLNALFCRLKTM